MPFINQRAESQRFTHRPVDPLAGLDHLLAVVHETLNGLVNIETSGRLAQCLTNGGQLVHRQARLAAPWVFVVAGRSDGLKARPSAIKPIGFVGFVGLASFVLRFKACTPVRFHLVDFAIGDDAFTDQFCGINFKRRFLRLDLAIHQRLGEARLIALVVAVAAVAPHIDHDRLLEAHPKFGGHFGGKHNSFRVIAIGVENGRFNHFRHIGGIGRRARIARVGCKADLVVDDEVNRSARAVAFKTG